jgi:AP2 domain
MHRRQPKRTVGPLTHISRSERDQAWVVDIIRAGRHYDGHFADAVWGGRRQALIAAQRHRDELLLEIEPALRVRRREARGRPPHSTGIVGVTFERQVVRGRAYERYVATWPGKDGVNKRQSFNVLKYGKRLAKALAIEARENAIDELRKAELARQREAARMRLRSLPTSVQLKDPRSRKGISMARRRPRTRAARR